MSGGGGTGVDVFVGRGVFVAVFGMLVEVDVGVAAWLVAVAAGELVAVGSDSDSVVGVAVSSESGAGSEPAVMVAEGMDSADSVSVGGISMRVGVGVLPSDEMPGSSTMASGVRASS